MSLILHLCKKDFRRSYLLLATWLLLVVLQWGLTASSLNPAGYLAHGASGTFFSIGSFLEAIVVAVLVAHLVFEEPPAGTTGFWLARPLPPGAVLREKVLFAAVLIGLPLVAEIWVLHAAGVTRHDLLLAVPEIVIAGLQWIVAIALIAALTVSFGQFAIAAVVVWVAMALLSMLAQRLGSFLSPDDYLEAGRGMLGQSRTIAAGVLAILGLGIAFVYQYLTRRRGRALAIALACELGVIAVGNFWPWNFFPLPPAPPAGIKVDSSQIKMQLRESQVQDQFRPQNAGEPKKNVAGTLAIVGLPPGYVALPTRVHPRLSFPDGRALPVGEPTASNYIFQPSAAVLEAALGSGAFVYGWRGFSFTLPTGLVAVDPDIFRKYANQPFTFSADFEFAVARFFVAARMPLVKGAHSDRGSEHTFVTAVLRDGDGVDVLIQRRNVKLLFGRPRTDDLPQKFLMSMEYHRKTYLLFNRKNQEAVRTNGINLLSQPVQNSRLSQEIWRLSFGPESYYTTPKLTDAWLADAELIELKLTTEGTFSASLAVEKFTLQGPNRAKTPAPSLPAPNPAILEQASLPAGATKPQVKDYVDHVLALSQRWTSFQKTDPPVAMLTKVGPENMDVLIGAVDRTTAFPAHEYLDAAIIELARPEDKALILQNLVTDPQLIDVVVKYKWEGDCRDTLIAMLQSDQQNYLPRNWLVAVASFKDPATYPVLKAYLLRTGARQQAYNVIRKLPGIDLRETVDVAWKLAKRTSPNATIEAAAMAIDIGYLDALDALVGVLRENDLSQPGQIERSATLVKRYTSATGDAAALVAWYDANKADLIFDAKSRKFVVSKQSSP
jgi:hypothetical protein